MIKELAIAAFIAAPVAASASGVEFPAGKACVAWKAMKTMFLLKKVEPVGINCSVTVRVSSKGGGKQVIVAIPIAGFDSGEKMRDKHVREILRSEVAPALVFTSRLYTQKEWRAVKAGKTVEIEGALSIGGESFPLIVPISVSNDAPMVASGALSTTFTRFKIEPPKVAGGLIANVHDHLELHYRVPIAAVIQ